MRKPTRKSAIEIRQGHPSGIDDIIEPLIKKAASSVKKSKRGIKKSLNDIPDLKFPAKKVYNSKGGMTKEYKDYVLRNSRGDY